MCYEFFLGLLTQVAEFTNERHTSVLHLVITNYELGPTFCSTIPSVYTVGNMVNKS